MYEQFFGLSEKPFSLTPDPRFVYRCRQYLEAEGQLLYGINSREGFMLVTGQPGTGKTTLCRDLIEKLDHARVKSALVFNPFLNGIEMLATLLAEFGVSVPSGGSRKELLDRLNLFLLAQLALGKSCVVIFDEAQHLSSEFLEQIRVLSNLETDREKLIQIVLVGQPELLDKIRSPGMAQLDQRVSIRCRLAHLDSEETDRYIHHRLNIAGARGELRFGDRAVSETFRASAGVPRLINLIADRALLAAYAAQTHDIGAAHIRKAVIALRGEEADIATAARSPRLPWRRRTAIVAAIAAALVVGAAITLGIMFWPYRAPDAETLYRDGAVSNIPAEAEQDFRTLLTEFPQSPRVNATLLRLSQLELARGARAEALQSLAELARRNPSGATHATALLWTARAQLDASDTVAACGSLEGTIADSVTKNVDLARQFAALAPACAAQPGFATKADSGKSGKPPLAQAFGKSQ